MAVLYHLFYLASRFHYFCNYCDRVRHNTLRKREDGTYVWTEWHGGQRTSDKDPSRLGGESFGDTDGGGD